MLMLLLGRIGKFLTPFVPYIMAVVLAALALGGMYVAGTRNGKLECKNESLKSAVVAQEKGAKNTKAANAKQAEVVTKYVDRIKVIHETKYITIKGIDRYVETDTGTLSPGFRVLHDAAAQGVVPDDSRIGDAESTTPKDVAAVTAENYAIYHETAEQLKLCQNTVNVLKEYQDAQNSN